ncbi:hypothetical protein ADK67_16600 [Saccharothrix sp. NRRL B-16348]|jgi:hypothetical protein|uniref:hypothetical protein n=1 Tax=Saccharothrix sp. NRRL B-16348 TaxID=1415542 RepID=UPI0006B02813|nr:hypothetical protein [Saccharothrix sp. NRRL B-16348]KOX25952.1 hypothetical protein ADK67_16600 [Saccharothrix sp. NRRL B-16348]
MSKRVIGAVLAAVFAATLGAATLGAAVSTAATNTPVVVATDPADPTDPPDPCADPRLPCDDYGWTNPGE